MHQNFEGLVKSQNTHFFGLMNRRHKASPLKKLTMSQRLLSYATSIAGAGVTIKRILSIFYCR